MMAVHWVSIWPVKTLPAILLGNLRQPNLVLRSRAPTAATPWPLHAAPPTAERSASHVRGIISDYWLATSSYLSSYSFTWGLCVASILPVTPAPRSYYYY